MIQFSDCLSQLSDLNLYKLDEVVESTFVLLALVLLGIRECGDVNRVSVDGSYRH